VELATAENFVPLMGEFVMDYSMNGRLWEQMGNDHFWLAPHNVYRCQGQGRWVTTAVRSEVEWAALCTVMHNANLATDPRFATMPQRHEHRRELDAIIGAWTADRDAYCDGAATSGGRAVRRSHDRGRRPALAPEHALPVQQEQLLGCQPDRPGPACAVRGSSASASAVTAAWMRAAVSSGQPCWCSRRNASSATMSSWRAAAAEGQRARNASALRSVSLGNATNASGNTSSRSCRSRFNRRRSSRLARSPSLAMARTSSA
jgi:hypothetical protein